MNKAVILLVAVVLGLTTMVKASDVVTDFKQEVTKHIKYPQFAEDNKIEGEVWMKVTLDENNKVQIMELSATNQALGAEVRKQLTDLTIENSSIIAGEVRVMKVKFNITK